MKNELGKCARHGLIGVLVGDSKRGGGVEGKETLWKVTNTSRYPVPRDAKM